MTCTECIDMLGTAALGRIPPANADADVPDRAALDTHLATCASCRATQRVLVASEAALAHSLDMEVASRPSFDIVEHALTFRRRAIRRRSLVGVLALVVALAGWEAWTVGAPEVRRLLAPPPPVVVQTFHLRCLSPEQATSLLRPYLPQPQNPRWQAERFDVTPTAAGIRAVTVRAPRELIDRVPALLETFERDQGAACRRVP
jgi:hypothetical protein